MLPSVAPGAVIEQIANGIVFQGLAVVGGEQIAPLAVTVGIGDGTLKTTQATCYIRKLHALYNIACIVIFPGVGEAACLVILPDQLIRAVVDIAGSICAIADCQNVAVVIVGVAFRLGISGRRG